MVLSLHKSGPDGPTETERQCFDISIDSPIQILSCYATLSNTLLPAYSGIHDPAVARIFECGCPDAIEKDESQVTQSTVIIPEVANATRGQNTVNQVGGIGRQHYIIS